MIRLPTSVVVAVSVVALAVGTLVVQRVRLRHIEGADAYHGIRLGMTVSEVRTQFNDEGGHWSVAGNAQRATLRWVADSPSPDQPDGISLDLHDGFVQVIRADLRREDPLATGERLESSLFSVLARERVDDDHVRVTVISRGCSKQASEVARLLALE